MIIGKRVNLRLITEADLDFIGTYINDIRWRGEFEQIDLIPLAQMKKKLAETGYWEEDTGILHVTDKEDHVLGYVSFWKPYSRPTRLAYEIAYAIDNPANWGKGFMTEAVSLFVPYLFAVRPTERIQATVLPGNIGSKRILEKTGFQYEGLLRKLFLSRGVPTDTELFSILREDVAPFAPGQ